MTRLYLHTELAITEEFAIYMNYVRKLGFEETPDYDFLRELFTKVLKTLGEPEDGVFDWMLLNGGKGWEAGHVSFGSQMVLDQGADARTDFGPPSFRAWRHASYPAPRPSSRPRTGAPVLPERSPRGRSVTIVAARAGADACPRQEQQSSPARCLAWRLPRASQRATAGTDEPAPKPAACLSRRQGQRVGCSTPIRCGAQSWRLPYECVWPPVAYPGHRHAYERR